MANSNNTKSFSKSDIQNYLKVTELNSIPIDWIDTTFGKAMTGFSSGSTPSRQRPDFFSGDILWITSGELNYNIVSNTKEKITEEAVKATNLKILEPGTFLMAITGLEAAGTRGSCAIVGKRATTNQSCMAIYPNEEVDLWYLFHFYVHYGELLAFKYCQGTKQQSYNGATARILPFHYPSKAEQKVIAKALNISDEAITKIQNLIAQKELRKKWLMQQLLTGKKRLKGFGGEWKEYKLEYFIEDYNEKPKEENNYDVLTSAKSGLMKQTDYYGDNRITNREDADYNVIPPNYLTYRSRSDDGLFTFNKNTLGVIGLISGYYPVFTIKNGNLDFILMYCNYYRQKLTKYSIGTSQLVLSMNALKSANFILPGKEEQIAIARLLQVADKEIQLLKAKAEKLKEEKKGMMQVLLTGEKRLLIS